MENNNGQSDLMKRLAEQTAKLMAVKTGAAQPTPAAPIPVSTPTPVLTPPAPREIYDVGPKLNPVEVAKAQFASGALKFDAASGQVYAKEGADSGWIMRPPTVAENIAMEEKIAKSGPAILPPDAPPRAVMPEAEDKPKRGRKPKVTVSVEQSDGTMTSPVPVDEMAVIVGQPSTTGAPGGFIAPPPAVTPPTAGAPRLASGPVIYVNCIPTKGEHKGQGIMFEEWMAPICEQVAQERGVVDWRLIQYTAKGDLAAKVRACISTLPPVVLVSKFSPAADVFLESVIPWASMIVQGV